MDEVVSNSVAERRLTMLLLTCFAGAALLLAAVGIYGVIAYGVTSGRRKSASGWRSVPSVATCCAWW